MRFSYIQAILSSIYIASTGGMFIIGYALKFGANDAQIGLISSLPMLCVVVQLLSARLVEKGISRRRMTIISAGLNVTGWGLVAFLPAFVDGSNPQARILSLLVLLVVITLFGHIANNARASWVGDLVPSERRGVFFGKITMYAGLVGTLLSGAGGVFLDHAKTYGVDGFRWVFLFGMSCGLLNTLLFVPQADIPVKKGEKETRYLDMIKETLGNKALMVVMAYAVVWSLQNIATPFYPTYLIRDLRMSFLGFSLVSSVGTLIVLVSSPIWGRIVDRCGCKPVLVSCTALAVPLPLVWIWLTEARTVYWVVPLTNIVAGIAVGGITVALTTLVYKVIPAVGRSVQLAVYSIAVLALAAPMPAIGGHLPDWLRAAGLHADLRCTFYASIPFALGASLIALRIQEPEARSTRELVRSIAARVCASALCRIRQSTNP